MAVRYVRQTLAAVTTAWLLLGLPTLPSSSSWPGINRWYLPPCLWSRYRGVGPLLWQPGLTQDALGRLVFLERADSPPVPLGLKREGSTRWREIRWCWCKQGRARMHVCRRAAVCSGQFGWLLLTSYVRFIFVFGYTSLPGWTLIRGDDRKEHLMFLEETCGDVICERSWI